MCLLGVCGCVHQRCCTITPPLHTDGRWRQVDSPVLYKSAPTLGRGRCVGRRGAVSGAALVPIVSGCEVIVIRLSLSAARFEASQCFVLLPAGGLNSFQAQRERWWWWGWEGLHTCPLTQTDTWTHTRIWPQHRLCLGGSNVRGFKKKKKKDTCAEPITAR